MPAVELSDTAFAEFAEAIETDPLDVLLTRYRRDAFIRALLPRSDVVEVIPSGSLARATNVGPIHDLDLIVVFDAERHPQWDGGSGTAAAALDELQAMLRQRLQRLVGPVAGKIYGTEPRNHVVRCTTDITFGLFEELLEGFLPPPAPPVDVMPAIRHGDHLRVPERRTDRWIDVDPEHLIRLVQERQREWAYFDQVVRMVKVWAEHQGLNIKPLALEFLVLKYLPRPRLFQMLPLDEAVACFFEAAHRAHVTDLSDPAGRSGSVDPHLDYSVLRALLREGADLSRQAVEAARPDVVGQNAATDPWDLWRRLFGRKFPKKKVLWYPTFLPPPVADRVGWSWAVWWTRLDPLWTWPSPPPQEDNPFRPPWDPPDDSPEGSPQAPADRPPGAPPTQDGKDLLGEVDDAPAPQRPLLFGFR